MRKRKNIRDKGIVLFESDFMIFNDEDYSKEDVYDFFYAISEFEKGNYSFKSPNKSLRISLRMIAQRIEAHRNRTQEINDQNSENGKIGGDKTREMWKSLNSQGADTEREEKRPLPNVTDRVPTGKPIIYNIEKTKNNIEKDNTLCSLSLDFSESERDCVCKVIELFNEICIKAPKAYPTRSRISLIHKMLVSQSNNIDEIKSVFETANNIDFLNGGGDKGWQFDFDWLLKEENWQRVKEGSFQRTSKSGFEPGQILHSEDSGVSIDKLDF